MNVLIEQYQDEIARLEAENAELRAALKPFADLADTRTMMQLDEIKPIWRESGYVGFRALATVGDCRNAKALLTRRAAAK